MKIVHHSFGGRFSDNPRAIYEDMLRTGYPAEHVWLLDPAHAHGFPAGTRTVEAGSARAVEELESADVVVSNTHIELDWVKSPGTLYVQTWHGTPLKHIHHDSLWAPPGRVAYLSEDVRRWDVLLSPNRASTEILRRAFAFPGPVIETGYPRNDVLSDPCRDELRATVRGRLGIRADETVVLYTPTWRDDVLDAHGNQDLSLQLDVDAFTRRLGRDHHLLVRAHPLISAELPALDRPGVHDVSAHPDIRELYLAADVMVTDYSSTMFDFAITGKPLLFFTYDLEHYRDSLRGFYFDFGRQAPGPLLHSGTEVLDALTDLDAVRARYAGAYQEFRARYCHLEDGAAAARVIEQAILPAADRERVPAAGLRVPA